MAARLPTVGGDDGNWGQILNDFLSITHKADGTLKDNSVTASAIVGLDSQIAANISDNSSATNTALAARDVLNILDYGVIIGTVTSQTAAIKAALDTHPGRAFYFPPGDYRLDTELVVSADNFLILDANARLYAAATMTTMITYFRSASGYTQDKGIIGGLLDGNLMANRVLSIGKVIHFTLERVIFKDGINRGLITESGSGAELIAFNLRFYNSGITNVSDNIAIEANMGDSHFHHIIMRDWTTAVKDTAANRWDRIHPWISQDAGSNTQMTSRYPSSIGFDLTGSSDLQACVADTYRYAYKIRSNGTSFTAMPRLLNCRAMWAEDPILTTALATANPGYVLDNSDGIGVISDRFTGTGPSTAPVTFLLGPATGMNTLRTYSYGYIKSYTGAVSNNLTYVNGVVQGTFTFSPIFAGTTGLGSHTYTAQTGHMVVNGDVVTYFVRIAGTLDSSTSFSGAWRIAGIPMPQGSNHVRRGAGAIGDCVGFSLSSVVIYEGVAAQISLQMVSGTSGSTAIDIVSNSIRGKTVDISLAVSVTHFSS